MHFFKKRPAIVILTFVLVTILCVLGNNFTFMLLQSSVPVPPTPVPPSTLAVRNNSNQGNENMVVCSAGATEKFLQITPRTSTTTNKAPASASASASASSNNNDGGNMTAAVMYNLQQMLDKKLCLSFVQQQKFFMVKDRVLAWVNNQTDDKRQSLLYETGKGPRSFAMILNERYAFRHIYKNGGTTVAVQTRQAGHAHIPRSGMEGRRLLATVRDPIEHFLSGWAECGIRQKTGEVDPDQNLNDRIQIYLNFVQDCVKTKRIGLRGPCICATHSLPQTNFLLDVLDQHHHTFDPLLDLVGDLREIPQVLELGGFAFNASLKNARNGSEDELKNAMFPARDARRSLSNETIMNLCEFVALDYYLLDFEPPSACLEKITSDIASIKNTVYPCPESPLLPPE